MTRYNLTLKQAVNLLAARSGLGYSIKLKGESSDGMYHLCQIAILGVLDYSEVSLKRAKTLYELLRLWFPDLANSDPTLDMRWDPKNWKKGEYIEPKRT